MENKQKSEEKISFPKDHIYAWKEIRAAREPRETQTRRRLLMLKKSLNEKTQSSFNAIKIFLHDHWYLLIKSAAHNHIRIQECKRKPGLGETCNLSFESYSHLKRYQKKVRLFTFSTSSTVISVLLAMLIVQIFFPGGKSQGATYLFNQASWSGGVTANTASHASNQTGWDEYQSKDDEISIVNGGADLQLALPSTQSVQDDADGQFNGTQSGDGFYTDGSGKLYLKKPATATCTLAEQCASGTCIGNVCQ